MEGKDSGWERVLHALTLVIKSGVQDQPRENTGHVCSKHRLPGPALEAQAAFMNLCFLMVSGDFEALPGEATGADSPIL